MRYAGCRCATCSLLDNRRDTVAGELQVCASLLNLQLARIHHRAQLLFGDTQKAG
jgi:hypothetical protein